MTLKESFKYRNVWMGLAMLWIMWFHLPIDISNELLRTIKNIGYGGVDIFLFASGLGCFFSLDKDDNCLIFLRRRANRLLPTYWMFLLFWIIYRKVFAFITWKAILANILCIADFAGVGLSFNWYINAIWVLYLLAPIFKKLVDEITSMKQSIFVITGLFLISVCFWNNANLIIVSRVPIFLIGMFFAKLSKQEIVLNKKSLTFIGIITVVGIIILKSCIKYHYNDLWNKGYWWYPFVLIAPGICILLSIFMEVLKNTKIGEVVEMLLGRIGEYSFELFLIHIYFFEIHNMLVSKTIIPDKDIYWGITCLLIIPGCLILNILKNIFINIVKKVYNAYHAKRI